MRSRRASHSLRDGASTRTHAWIDLPPLSMRTLMGRPEERRSCSCSALGLSSNSTRTWRYALTSLSDPLYRLGRNGLMRTNTPSVRSLRNRMDSGSSKRAIQSSMGRKDPEVIGLPSSTCSQMQTTSVAANADERNRLNSEAPGVVVGVGRLKVTRERSMPVLVLWIKWPAGLSWLREAASRSLWARSLSDHGGWQDRFHSDSRVIASPYPSWKPCTRPTAAV